jgi:cytochrome P450
MSTLLNLFQNELSPLLLEGGGKSYEFFFFLKTSADDMHSYYFCFAVLAVSVYYISMVRQPTKPFKDLPMSPGCHWLLGHIQAMKGDFRKNQRTLFTKDANKHGQIGFWMGPKAALAVHHWEDARTILYSEYHRIRVPLTRKHLAMFLGDRSIGVMKGREWKFHRSFIMRAFSQQAVHNSKAAVEEVAATFVDSMKRQHLHSPSDSVVLDVETLTKMVTMDVFGKAAFSTNFGCCDRLEPSEAVAAFDLLGSELSKRIFNPISIPNYFYSFPSDANRNHLRARTCLRGFLKKAISERRDNKNFAKRDLLSLMLQAHEELKSDAKGAKDREEDLEQLLSDTMMTLLFAGYDTTSITLTYAIYLVSQHPEIEKLCLEEVESQPEELIFCKGVILETLRMFPPATIVPRTLLKSVKLSGGFVAPEGTQVYIPIWLIQQDETVWPSPEQFRPDRWVRREDKKQPWVDREETDISSSEIAPAFRKAFFAFSGGARSCPGQRFAVQESVLVLAGVLKELSFETVPGYELNPARSGIVQRPKGGLPMKIQRRTPA